MTEGGNIARAAGLHVSLTLETGSKAIKKADEGILPGEELLQQNSHEEMAVNQHDGEDPK